MIQTKHTMILNEFDDYVNDSNTVVNGLLWISIIDTMNNILRVCKYKEAHLSSSKHFYGFVIDGLNNLYFGKNNITFFC